MKKIETAVIAFTFIIVVIIFANCNKNATTSNNKNDNLSLANSSVKPYTFAGPCPYECHDPRCKVYQSGYCGPETISIIKNTNNPYDYVGGEHNNGVAYILTALGGPSTNDTLLLNADIGYMQTLGYTAAQVDTAYNQGVRLGYFPFSKIPELDSLGNLMYSQGKISSTANNYVQQIFNLASQYLEINVDSVDFSLDSANYISFSNSLISLESSINNNSNLTSAEKTGLLSGCSIGRYSALYWANYLLSGNGEGSGGSESLASKLTWKFWKIVICDIAGGFAGSPGGLVGIISGSIAASVGAA